MHKKLIFFIVLVFALSSFVSSSVPVAPGMPQCEITAEVININETQIQRPNVDESSERTELSVNITKITKSEERLIDNWIEEEGLNQYGDEPDTAYTGGTPLFDEETGESIERIEYIKTQNPQKPWLDEKYNPCNETYKKQVRNQNVVPPEDKIDKLAPGVKLKAQVERKGDAWSHGYFLSNVEIINQSATKQEQDNEKAGDDEKEEAGWFKRLLGFLPFFG